MEPFGSLRQLKAEEAEAARQWLDLLHAIDEMASMRANEPNCGGLQNFRAMQQLAHETGRRRVALQTRIATLERAQQGSKDSEQGWRHVPQTQSG